MELEVKVLVCRFSIGQMAMDWSLAPSQYEGGGLLVQISSTCHIPWCTWLHHVPSEARSSLAELLFILATLPLNDFHKCPYESLSSHNRLHQVKNILGENLKKIIYIKFHVKCRTSQTCIGSGELGVYPLAVYRAGDMRRFHQSMLGLFLSDRQVW